MKNNLEQFRIIDLTLLSLLAIISEMMGNILHLQLPGAGYYLSFSVLITIIAMVRWNEMGAIVLVIANVPMIFLGQNTVIVNFIIYVMASCFVVIAGRLLKSVNKVNYVKDPIKLFLIVIVTYMTVALGKAVGLFVLGDPFLTGSIMYFVAQLFNILMSYLALLLLKRRHGLLMDMKDYFEGHNMEERL